MVQGMGIPPSQLQRELAEEDQDAIDRAGRHDGKHRDRSTVARLGPRFAIRGVLLLAALIALRFGVTRMQDWDNMGKATFHHTWQGWIGWLLLVTLSGLLFALAARLPRTFRYRGWTPLLVGLIPFLMLAHGVTLYSFSWEGAPGVYLNSYFYMTFPAQSALAVMLGVALASGFDRREGQP